ncbi:MAG TPA: hypothetical protein DEO60_14110 [Bacteroidales bacterium]|nr:hypothetical protein [Bacteroidales bacterium]HBZ22263.1 hypothetical protein [Bacteroidales bacterium]
MLKKLKYLLFFLLLLNQTLISQETPKAYIYLLTCGPGTETYSVYGHSALRVVIQEKNSDLVYNWGVFDFATPNFAWKFAKGRLDYSLGISTYDNFLKDYFSEGRWVVSQKLNLETTEIEKLFFLIAENLKPENLNYRYDFFYDDCSTRIRDIIEKAVGENLIYPPPESGRDQPTFRYLTGEYEKTVPWTKVGIDLIMGSPGDKKASFRDKMFLPVELKNGLSELLIRRNGKMIPLLTNPEVVIDFEQPTYQGKLLTSPVVVFSVLLIILIILTGYFRGKRANNVIDIATFGLFSILALLMIFFNFFTDHQQMKWNLNIIWLNPFIILCFISLLLKKDHYIWFRLVFFLAAGFLAFLVFLPQHINNAFVPLIFILILRSSVRANFSWNPLSLPHLTEL